MYAIIENGGKQYRVAPGDVVKLEVYQSKEGSKIDPGKLLFLFDDNQYFAGKSIPTTARVEATIIEKSKDPKILVFKKKRRKQYRRTRGHRQQVMRVKIDSIHL
ncbi:MAG TPA: 50S ribosomal protein L21 [Acidobacteriota bacterium]|nr:50S ribosomal protein L21 [Acidobacteriota bacterium]